MPMYDNCVVNESLSRKAAPDTEEDAMPVKEATLEETPYGRYVTSEGWFVVNLGDAHVPLRLPWVLP